MTTWNEFYDYTLPELNGIGTDLLDLTLRNVARDFCYRTNLLTETLDTLDAVADQADYTVTPTDSGTEVVKILGVWYDDLPLTPQSTTKLNKYPIDYRTLNATIPYTYTQTARDRITFVPTPSEDGTDNITVEFSLQPVLTATGVPDVIGDPWREVIACGAKSKLMAMAQRPWTDPNGAVLQTRMYEAGVQKGVVEFNRAHSRADGIVSFPGGWSCHRRK